MSNFNDALRLERAQGKLLRQQLHADLLERRHRMSDWKEYKSQDGKWTSHCHGCGGILIQYDYVSIAQGDQIVVPKPLQGECCGEEDA